MGALASLIRWGATERYPETKGEPTPSNDGGAAEAAR